MDDRNFHLILHSIYRLPEDATFDNLRKLEALTERRLAELDPESLITVMYAFARTQPVYVPSRTILDRFVSATRACMGPDGPGASARQLQHAIFCVQALRLRPGPDWHSTFIHTLDARLPHFSDAELLDTLASAARAGMPLSVPAASALLQACARELPYAHAARVALTAWTLGHFGCRSTEGGEVVCPGQPGGPEHRQVVGDASPPVHQGE